MSRAETAMTSDGVVHAATIAARQQCEERCRRIVWYVVVPVHAMLLGWIACRYSPTPDEVAHLAAGVGIWEQWRFDHYPVNPPLVKMVAAIPVLLDLPKVDWHGFSSDPALRREWDVGRSFVYANGRRGLWFFTIARWACIPFSLVGLVYCYQWSRELFGAASGTCAALMWCFSPSILGNAAQIAPDAAAAALGVCAAYHFRLWLLNPTWNRVLIAGTILGVAELTKMTWVILFGVFPIVWGLFELHSSRVRLQPRSVERRFRQLCALIAIALATLNAGYGFEGSGARLSTYHFVSRSLGGPSGSGNRFKGTLLGELPVPLPRAYLQGLDLQRRDFEGGWRPMYSYLHGEHRIGGWWYYYLYAMCVKVPLGAGGAAIASAFASYNFKRLLSGRRAWVELLILAAPPLTVFVVVSANTGFSRYLRYLLPCFPFCYIWISGFASPLTWRRHSTIPVVGAICLLSTICSSLVVYPHSLAFFNLLAGGPRAGHWHLLDSNFDASQDMYCLKEWIDAHPGARPVYIAHSSIIDCTMFGIEAEPAPRFVKRNKIDLPAGWYAVSANHLHGYDSDDGPWTYFQEFNPVDRAGYTVLIYHVE